MKNDLSVLFAFQSNNRHDKINRGCYHALNGPQDTQNRGHTLTHLENAIQEREYEIDSAFRHSEGVF